MKLLFALVICLVVFTSWVTSLDSYVAVACNGQDVLAIAELAVDHINKDRKHGYKFSVDRIENAQEMTEASGKTVYLDIDVRETKCHVLSPKLLKDCEIRPFKETKVEGDCEVIVETKSGAPSQVIGYKCEISPDSAEDVSEKCLDCPHLIFTNATEAEHAATVSLNKFNELHNHTHTFKLQKITRASTKGPGTPVSVEYIIQETPCIKGQAACILIALLSPDLGFCTATVTPDGEKVAMDCEIDSTKKAKDYKVALIAPEGEGGVSPAPEGEAGASPAPEVEAGASPAPEGEAGASPAPEVEAGASPAPEVEAGASPAPEGDGGAASIEPYIMTPAAQEIEPVTPAIEKSVITPKRKRSVPKESSESSEEHIASDGRTTIHFPDLPADQTTCPGKHKYPEDQ
uniref:alpha-2-HS-glycoprotein-like n=1 Tax=Pristiophorus japonicus TaxID=55135 RepID=UPI00398F1381